MLVARKLVGTEPEPVVGANINTLLYRINNIVTIIINANYCHRPKVKVLTCRLRVRQALKDGVQHVVAGEGGDEDVLQAQVQLVVITDTQTLTQVVGAAEGRLHPDVRQLSPLGTSTRRHHKPVLALGHHYRHRHTDTDTRTDTDTDTDTRTHKCEQQQARSKKQTRNLIRDR